MSVKRTSCRYDATGFKVPFQVCATEQAEDGKAVTVTPELRDLRRMTDIIDWLPADAERRQLDINGKAIMLIGFKSRSPRFPFLGITSDGKRYKFTEGSVRFAFDRSNANTNGGV